MPIVVSDASPIFALNHVRRLDLLDAMFSRTIVPPAVKRELTAPRSGLESVDLSSIMNLEVEAPRDQARVEQLLRTLDQGESEAIALALEVGARRLLIDEYDGRSAAKKAGLKPLGALGVLLRAKRRGLLTAVLPLAVELRTGLHFYISDRLLKDLARRARE